MSLKKIKQKMKISIFSLFRDSEKTIQNTLSMLDSVELATDAEFEYFFYENDSKDNTVDILKIWGKGKKCSISSELLHANKYQSTLHTERMIHMSKIRNKMLELGKDSDSDYSIVFDSDVTFYPEIINDFLKFKNLDFSMLTPNIRQNVPCKMENKIDTSYYDSSILFDTNGINCMTWSDNPFYEEEDRNNFMLGNPVEVQSAFGGFAFLESKALLNCSWQSSGESEHLSFCKLLKKYGKIFVIPTIKPSVTVDRTHWNHEHLIIKRQSKLLENPWNRFLWKSGSLDLE